MARASRKLAISHLAQHAAQRLLGDGDTELLENPLAKDRGTVRNSVSGPVYCSREEPILEHDRELRFRLAPFPWRHFPLACDLTQDKIDKLRRRLVGWKMSPDFDGAPQLCV